MPCYSIPNRISEKKSIDLKDFYHKILWLAKIKKKKIRSKMETLM